MSRKLSPSQVKLLEITNKAPLERWLMSKEEISDAEKLVKMGYLQKGSADNKQGNRQFCITGEGMEKLEELEEADSTEAKIPDSDIDSEVEEYYHANEKELDEAFVNYCFYEGNFEHQDQKKMYHDDRVFWEFIEEHMHKNTDKVAASLKTTASVESVTAQIERVIKSLEQLLNTIKTESFSGKRTFESSVRELINFFWKNHNNITKSEARKARKMEAQATSIIETTTGDKLIKRLEKIVEEGQYQKIDGQIVDLSTASVILKVIEHLREKKPDAVEKFLSLPIGQMANVAWKATGKKTEAILSSDMEKKLTEAMTKELPDCYLRVSRGSLGGQDLYVHFASKKENWPNGIINNDPLYTLFTIKGWDVGYNDVIEDPKLVKAELITGFKGKLRFPSNKMSPETLVKKLVEYFKAGRADTAESSILYSLWFKDHEDSKKWQKSALKMKDKDSMFENAKKLKAQEGWYDVMITTEDEDPNKKAKGSKDAILIETSTFTIFEDHQGVKYLRNHHDNTETKIDNKEYEFIKKKMDEHNKAKSQKVDRTNTHNDTGYYDTKNSQYVVVQSNPVWHQVDENTHIYGTQHQVDRALEDDNETHLLPAIITDGVELNGFEAGQPIHSSNINIEDYTKEDLEVTKKELEASYDPSAYTSEAANTAGLPFKVFRGGKEGVALIGYDESKVNTVMGITMYENGVVWGHPDDAIVFNSSKEFTDFCKGHKIPRSWYTTVNYLILPTQEFLSAGELPTGVTQASSKLTFPELVGIASKCKKPEYRELKGLVLDVDDEEFVAYGVNIAHRELGFECDKGYVSYVIDMYGDRPVAELYEVERVEATAKLKTKVIAMNDVINKAELINSKIGSISEDWEKELDMNFSKSEDCIVDFESTYSNGNDSISLIDMYVFLKDKSLKVKLGIAGDVECETDEICGELISAEYSVDGKEFLPFSHFTAEYTARKLEEGELLEEGEKAAKKQEQAAKKEQEEESKKIKALKKKYETKASGPVEME